MSVVRIQKSIEIAHALVDEHGFNHRCRHVSVVFRRNRVMVIGRNINKTHPANIKNLPAREFDEKREMIHRKMTCSELNAFNYLKKRGISNFNDLILVNVRIDRNGNIVNSKPCIYCQNLIEYIGFREVLYSNGDGDFVKY